MTKMTTGFLQMRKKRVTSTPAFTLVELLVVIGIIAVLIAILLPSLGKAREASKRAACAAKLHQIMIAAANHVVDHKGYFPIVGQINGIAGQSGPAALADTYTSNYTWLGDFDLSANKGDFRLLAPITLALGTEMGFKSNLNLDLASMLTANGLSRNFQCPSQAVTDEDLLKHEAWLYAGYFGAYYGGFVADISYIFNEGVLGFDDSYGRLRGHASSIRQSSKTFFACDGLGGSVLSRPSGKWSSFNAPGAAGQPWPSLTMFNVKATAPVTMNDVLTHQLNGKTIYAGDVQNFDQVRHKGVMNIAFCDGHVEQRDIPKFTIDPSSHNAIFPGGIIPIGLSDVFLLAP